MKLIILFYALFVALASIVQAEPRPSDPFIGETYTNSVGRSLIYNGRNWQTDWDEYVRLLNLDELILPKDGDKVYLDPIHGSDVTAGINSPMRPYKTWEAAVLGATDNCTILCAQGTIEITGEINRDQVSIYAPQTDFVRGEGWDGFLFDVNSPAVNDGSKIIVVNSITGQNILRTGTKYTYFRANRVHLIDEGLVDNSAEDGVNPNTAEVVCLFTASAVVGSEVVNLDLEIGHLSSALLGSASPTPQILTHRSGVGQSDIVVTGNIGKCSNINFRKIGTYTVSLDLTISGDVINDAVGFEGGILGESSQSASSTYDYFRLKVGGKISSLCGEGGAVIKTNLGEWSFTASGGIESLDNEPAIWVSDSEVNSFGSSKTYIKAPFAVSNGAPLRMANNDRDAIYDGVHFTSSNPNSLVFPNLLQAGNSSASHLFKDCSTDLTGGGNYLSAGGEIDLGLMQVEAGFSNNSRNNNTLLGSISLIEGYSASFISQFNY